MLQSIISFLSGISTVLEGFQKAGFLDVDSYVKKMASGAAEEAFERVRGPFTFTIITIALTAIGVFFMAWGASILIDLISLYKGVGFLLVGLFLLLLAAARFRVMEVRRRS